MQRIHYRNNDVTAKTGKSKQNKTIAVRKELTDITIIKRKLKKKNEKVTYIVSVRILSIVYHKFNKDTGQVLSLKDL